MPTLTTNYSLNKPLINDPTDQDLWGDYMNTNMDLIDTALDNLLTSLYPVGSLYINASVATNPATLLGFGTWAAFGEGRVLVGAGTLNDGVTSKTLAAGATGGEFNHALTSSENAQHTHTLTDPGHTHVANLKNGGGGGTGGSLIPGTPTLLTLGTSTTGITVDNSGSGTLHNIMQPYIAVYIWQRTA